MKGGMSMSKSGGYRRLFAAVLLVAVSIGTGGAFGAQASGNTLRAVLPVSPISASTLVAQAVHAGTLRPQRVGSPSRSILPSTKPKPAPSALADVQASEGGAPVNEDPIAVNVNNGQQLLTGGNDYNCDTFQGFYSSSNGGATWLTHCLDALPGQFGEGDPVVGYDLLGNSYIGGIDCLASDCSTGGEIVFEKSTNNGATWSAPAVAVPALFADGLADKDWLQVDTSTSSPNKNRLYISVTQFGHAGEDDITVSHSVNGGAT